MEKVSAWAENPSPFFETGLAFSARAGSLKNLMESQKNFSPRVEPWAGEVVEYSAKQNGSNGGDGKIVLKPRLRLAM